MKIRNILFVCTLLFLPVFLISCKGKEETLKSKNAYYEIFVASFHDSDGDGTGDLNGVVQKLDYLKDLGVGGIWLMPIMPSQSYHKYDVDDYYAVDKSYGTMEDFENLVKEARKREIDIILDLPVNHTSDTHPWFVEAAESFKGGFCGLGKSTCAYYNFDFEPKTGYAKLDEGHYYEAVFWEGMPDLNLDNPHLREDIKDIAYFWLDKGVKGFRLDAVLHFYDSNTAKNNAFVKWFSDAVKEKRADAFIVGETWAADSVILDHYGSGIDSMFHFGFSGADGGIVQAVRTGKGEDLASKVLEYREKMKALNSAASDSVFLSNHDQARSAGYVKGVEEQKLMASLYLVLPAHPFLYYGEEIGLRGSGKDENKRLPMLWGEGKDCKAPIDADYRNQIETSVKEQQKDEDSLLSHYKKVLHLRNKYLCKDMIVSENKIMESIFSMKYEDRVLMINLSKESVELDVEAKLLEAVDILGKTELKAGKLKLAGYGMVVLE